MRTIIGYFLIAIVSLIGNRNCYAQQLIYNQSFENIFRNINTPQGGVRWYQYNQFNFNMNTHTYAFAYGADTFSKSLAWLEIIYAKGDTFQNPYILAVDGARFLALSKYKHIGLWPNGYYYNAYLAGIALEIKSSLKINNYYLCRFYSYYEDTASGLSIGVSVSQQSFGSIIGHVYPPHEDIFTSIPTYSWKKFTILFQSHIAASNVTFMGDFDTSVNTVHFIDNCSLYPVKFCGIRTVSFCKGDSLKLKALLHGNNYEWSTGDSGLYITVKDTGYLQSYTISHYRLA